MDSLVEIQTVTCWPRVEARTPSLQAMSKSPTSPECVWELATPEQRQAVFRAVVSVCLNLSGHATDSAGETKERNE